MFHENSIYHTVIAVVITIGYIDKCHQFRSFELYAPNGRFRSYNRVIHDDGDGNVLDFNQFHN